MSELENLLEIDKGQSRPQQSSHAGAAATPRVSGVASASGVAYDPAVIQRYATHLYSRAAVTVLIYTILWMLLLGGAGLALDSETGADGLIAVVGALVGGFLGYSLGSMKANAMRLEAQVALCQVEIEKNTR